MLLSGLPERKNVLHKLQRVLAPGGAIVVQDWGPWRSSQVLYAEGLAAGRVFDRFTMALDQVMTDRGTSARWAVEAHRHLRELDFVEATTSVMARNWAGGTPGCLLLRALAQRLRAELLDVDLTAADLTDVDGLLTDPATTIIGTPVWSTTAFRPCPSVERGRR